MEIKQNALECLENLQKMNNQSEFLEILFNYLRLISPALDIEMPLSDSERIIRDF